jgi:hypothetical protein
LSFESPLTITRIYQYTLTLNPCINVGRRGDAKEEATFLKKVKRVF